MTGVARGAGTTYPLRAAEFTIFTFVMFCGSLFVLLFFFLPFDDFRVLITSLWYVETVLRTEERRLGTDLDMQ
jgi:hypothetical protein